MTHATKAVYRWILADYVRVSNMSVDEMLYSEADIVHSMDKIETVNFHQEMEITGIKFQAYNAGHVLGAAMFSIEIAGVRILYTGDFSRQEDRHLMAAELPAFKPDVLIVESTYGTHIHDKREDRETRFTSLVYETLNRGGRVLIPVFALGRAQELLLILEEYWEAHPELHDYPVYYASQLARKCMSVYQTFIYSMNDRIKQALATRNPFQFRHISSLRRPDDSEQVGPCVVMASPGMLQSGFSRELFEAWCIDSRNAVIITGYVVEGTPAKLILNAPSEIISANGQKLPLNCSVDYVSFSAHTDYQQTSDFIRALKPSHIILVHGEQNEMMRLKVALIRQYEAYNATLSNAAEPYDIDVHTPRNSDAVKLPFRGEKMAKLVGRLAHAVTNLTDDSPELHAETDAQNDAVSSRQNVEKSDSKHPTAGKQCRVSGLLVKRNFNYHVVAPDELAQYTDLQTCTIAQKQAITYTGSAKALFDVLERVTEAHLELLDPAATNFELRATPSLCDESNRPSLNRSESTNAAATLKQSDTLKEAETLKQTDTVPKQIDDVKLDDIAKQSGASKTETTHRIADLYEANTNDNVLAVRAYQFAIVRYTNDQITLEWLAAPLNDTLVDALVIAILKLVRVAPHCEPGMPIRRSTPFANGVSSSSDADTGDANLGDRIAELRRTHLRDCVIATLVDMFAIEPDAYANIDTDTFRVTVNDRPITINLRTNAVQYVASTKDAEHDKETEADRDVLESVSNVVRRLEWILTPSSGEAADYVCCA